MPGEEDPAAISRYFRREKLWLPFGENSPHRAPRFREVPREGAAANAEYKIIKDLAALE